MKNYCEKGIHRFIKNIPFLITALITGSMLLFVIDCKEKILYFAFALVITMFFLKFDFTAIKKQCSIFVVIVAVAISAYMSIGFYEAIKESTIINHFEFPVNDNSVFIVGG